MVIDLRLLEENVMEQKAASYVILKFYTFIHTKTRRLIHSFYFIRIFGFLITSVNETVHFHKMLPISTHDDCLFYSSRDFANIPREACRLGTTKTRQFKNCKYYRDHNGSCIAKPTARKMDYSSSFLQCYYHNY